MLRRCRFALGVWGSEFSDLTHSKLVAASAISHDVGVANSFVLPWKHVTQRSEGAMDTM